ncbi:MAG: 60S ribosomal protein L5 [Vezdaea aestivalis]|nr:MAG: 60S ribosomal protein L5 [Vezdaea aestivalis]
MKESGNMDSQLACPSQLLTPLSPSLPTSMPLVTDPIPLLPITPPSGESEGEFEDEMALDTAFHVLSTEAIALQCLAQLYKSDRVARTGFAQAVEQIARTTWTGGKLIIAGVGKSGKIAKKLVATMNSMGILTTFLHPIEALHGDLGIVRPIDTLLLITFSGKTPELVALMSHIPLELPIISMTSHDSPGSSPLTANRPKSILLPTPLPVSEARSFGVSAPTTSTTVTIALGDALALAVAQKAFTKTVKSSAYFSRFQTKYKRRISGKTDYARRKKLVTQAKNKYNTPKYRLVVRFTNRDIIAQIVTSEISGDKVFCSAYSHELKRYGIKHGLTNWAAGYCVGLLIGRRALKKLGLDEQFTGVEEADGEYQVTEAAEDEDGESRRPFKCILDVGLQRTSTGSRVFSIAKGVSDAGVFLPHNEKRFPGYDNESKELDSETLRKYIYGGHVAEFMESLADEDEIRYQQQFKSYIDDDLDAEGIEELYTEAHKAIREDPLKADPDASKKTKAEYKKESLKFRTLKLSKEEKDKRVQDKIARIRDA